MSSLFAQTMFKDTIYALATAPGKSGVAVIRISGAQALPVLKRLTGMAITPRHAHYVRFMNNEGEAIDRGLALYFPAPHSFTGEDVAECHLHGSIAVIQDMLATLAAMGLRMAEPGEFTRRAFMQGKMDLLEAEGLADLIDAETSQQKSQALKQMEGALSGAYDDIRLRTIECMALLEAYIDFPDEGIPESVLDALEANSMRLQGDIRGMLDDQRRGERLRDGINVVILGAPNAGKSSLLNALARRDVAIVSHQPGTTRDMIEVHLDIAGYPVVVVDTAGLRDSHDDIEAEGIRRARERAASADIRLVLFDSKQWPKQDKASLALLDDTAMTVISKYDLCRSHGSMEGAICLSTQTGEGVNILLEHIKQRIEGRYASRHSPVITRERHRTHLTEALKYIEKSMEKKSLELACEELRQAALAVGKITGKIQVDDVLDVIFKRFCIGK